MTAVPLPVLALTLGDVAGIGPEITAKTLLQHPELREICVPVVIGDADAHADRCGAGRARPRHRSGDHRPAGGRQRPGNHRAVGRPARRSRTYRSGS